MISRPMRKLPPLGLLRTPLPARQVASLLPVPATATITHSTRSLAQVRDAKSVETQDVWFSSSAPRPLPEGLGHDDLQGHDERTVKLGKISGRIAYTAALWTAPVAWGRIPVLGNVKLDILSERLVKYGGTSTPAHFRNHRLIVRWKTCRENKLKNGSEVMMKLTEYIIQNNKKEAGAFCGLFIFEFDEQGRILTHTIEHVDEGGSWERPNRVISVTDWLLGKAWGKRDDVGGLALHAEYCKNGPNSEMDPLRCRR